ncbi:aldehyde dehydrogenase family 3 member B1-like [Sceloporus undulatus]|uniref:aldehyde dehydrogenase family 3 member B1-like n=1 Tax=Sceloporus undulatus TaxID=8520 RepID=UPI001C4B515A|nr:aldehyde dehydrogenase family 3 member B1-like [Sceloporus undulatus]
MERAGEVVQSIFSGQWDVRQHQEVQNQGEGTQHAISITQEIEQHTLQEVPLQNEVTQNAPSGEQQSVRNRLRVPGVCNHSGGVQIIPGGQRNTNTRQHRLQDVPRQSDNKQNSTLSSINPYKGLVDCLRTTWLSGTTRSIEYRKEQLEALGRFLDERKSDLFHALQEDLRKPAFEAELTEVSFTKNEVNYALNNLDCWMKDEYVTKNLATKLDSAFIRKDPFGVVLIIAAYNYPINLALVPLVGAIAAGNCVILKPSEISSCTERLLAEALPCYLDPETFAVVTGGQEETTKLLENKFDYIFFTGDLTF